MYEQIVELMQQISDGYAKNSQQQAQQGFALGATSVLLSYPVGLYNPQDGANLLKKGTDVMREAVLSYK